MEQQLLVELVKPRSDGMVVVPDDCWVFDAETKNLVTEKAVTVERATKLIVVPKIAGG